MATNVGSSNAYNRNPQRAYGASTTETLTIGAVCEIWDVFGWTQTYDTFRPNNMTIPLQTLFLVFQLFHDSDGHSQYQESKALRQQIEVDLSRYWQAVPVRGYGKVCDPLLKMDVGPNKFYNYVGHSLYIGFVVTLLPEPDEYQISYYMRKYLFEEEKPTQAQECLIKARRMQVALRI